MVMEARDDEFSDCINGFSLDDESILPVYGQTLGLNNGFRFRDEPLDLSFLEIPNSTPSFGPSTSDRSSTFSSQSDSPDEFADCVFKYINQILVDEDMEAKQSMYNDSLALQETERSFYEALGEKFPPVSNVETPEQEYSTSSSTSGSNSTDSQSSVTQTPSIVTSNNFGILESMINTDLVKNIFTDRESILQFNRGMAEASKFLPRTKPIVIDLDQYNLPSNSRDTPSENVAKEEIIETNNSSSGHRGRKHYQMEETDYEEERSSKQSALFVEEDVLSDMFDKLALCTDADSQAVSTCEEPSKKGTKKSQNGHAYGYSSSGWITRSWGGSLGEATDVRTLLVNCAQSVAVGDRSTASEQLKQIRQNASPTGDAPQRLAYTFATGLEARLAGTGSQLYANKGTMTISPAEKLKAYQAYRSACPFDKIGVYFVNTTIFDAASTSSTLHIVDFGISYGFQWPVLIKYLAERPGGPPKLRMTGIELPKRGFRPAEGVEETGRRLASYCAKYKVQFEYNGISSRNWESIKIEDLKLQRNECLAVNTFIRLENMLDEKVIMYSPRDAVLKLIRDMKPDIFVQTVVNGSYNSPNFVTRFKEALFHFSSMFDMLNATLERGDEQRLNFEKEFCGREVMNVIACEGGERVERPETFDQWQVRLSRAGFSIKPLNRELVPKLKAKVKSGFHKDFVFDEDGKWVLQGWKGRILRASSCWVPS